MRQIGRFVAFYALCTVAAPCFAQDTARAIEQQEGRESPEGGSAFPGADINEEHASGIINWFSWDYGPNAKDPSHKNWPPPFGFAIINFFIFVAVMGKLAWPGIRKMMVERHEHIAKDLKEAAALRKEAEQQLEQYKAKVANIDREIEALLAQVKKEAIDEKARIIAAAEAEAKRLKADAEKQIAAEIDRARRELRRGVIEAAVAAADEALRKNIGADDQRKMAERYVHDVEAQAKHGRA